MEGPDVHAAAVTTDVREGKIRKIHTEKDRRSGRRPRPHDDLDGHRGSQFVTLRTRQMMNEQGRPTTPAVVSGASGDRTFTANRGLQIEEPLLFEIGRHDVTGVDLPPAPAAKV